MKEHPLIFSAPMVRAILAGTKTQTRRVINPQPLYSNSANPRLEVGAVCACPDMLPTGDKRGLVMVHCESQGTYHHMGQVSFVEKFSRWKPGDRFWVKETFWCEKPEPIIIEGCAVASGGDPLVYYYADYVPGKTRCESWKSSRYMPRCLSRISRQIVAVRAERLQDIGKDGLKAHDVLAEGVTLQDIEREREWFHADDAPALAFSRLWDSINGKHPGKAWKDNPWVWVIEWRNDATETP